MLDENLINSNETRAMQDLTFKEIVRIIVLKPTSEIDIVLNQVKFKYIYLFPALYGVITGISKSVSKVGLSNIPLLLTNSLYSILIMTAFTFVFVFIYAWIIKYISNLLQGIANINMTYGLLSYSLIPIIIGALIYLSLKILFYTNGSLRSSIDSFNQMIYYSQILFVFWSLFILIIGNAFINSFSMARSFISSAGLIIVLFYLLYSESK